LRSIELASPEMLTLEIIEFPLGSNQSEDVSVRQKDIYGRVAK